MKDKNVEELLYDIWNVDGAKAAMVEILSRFTALEAEVKRLNIIRTEMEADANKFPTMAEFSNLQDDNERLEKEVKRLTEERDNRKCCGNCRHHNKRNDCVTKHEIPANKYCDYWTPDNLRREDRKC